ncbi:MAG: amidohydrolase [Bacillota bacterium]
MDLVLFNGDVHTLDRAGTQAEAVAVRNGKIAAVGSSPEIRNMANAKTEVIDLKGRTLLPGFIDAHNHMIMYGIKFSDINCQDGTIKSIAQITEEVGRQAKQKPPGDWITCWGYDDAKLLEKRHPSRWDFDRVAVKHPVVCHRACNHVAVVNSKALELMGITRETPDPAGGVIERDVSGEPTGILKENALNLVKKAIPTPGVDRMRKAIKQAGAVYNREGVTSVHEAGAGFAFPGPNEVRAFQSALQHGDLSVRVYMMVYTELLDELVALGFRTGFGNDFLRIGSYKIFTDGGFGGKTAALEEPYQGDVTRGIISIPKESLIEKMRKAHRAGFQLAVHAIGDRAINMVLDAFEAILKEYPRLGHRHRIEHFALATPPIIQRAKKLNLVPVPQAGFIYYFGDSYIDYLGEDRIMHVYPLRSLLEAGLITPLSSDRPGIPGYPLRGIETAVLRETYTGQVVGLNQAITIDRALRMYTNYAAYASFEEERKGSIEPGKLADFVVLGASPFKVPPKEIASIPVELTIVDGRIVYRN